MRERVLFVLLCIVLFEKISRWNISSRWFVYLRQSVGILKCPGTTDRLLLSEKNNIWAGYDFEIMTHCFLRSRPCIILTINFCFNIIYFVYLFQSLIFRLSSIPLYHIIIIIVISFFQLFYSPFWFTQSSNHHHDDNEHTCIYKYWSNSLFTTSWPSVTMV